MKLYFSPGACSLASHIALVEGGVGHEAVKVDLASHTTQDGEDFRAISPRGYVPAIVDDGIGLLTENPAVLTYIADKTGTLPAGPDFYHLLEWLGYIGTEIHGGYHPLFGRDSEDRQARARETLASKYAMVVKLMEGREWLVGDRPTVADNYLFVTLLWARKFRIDLPHELAAYRDRNLGRAAVKQAMQAEGLG